MWHVIITARHNVPSHIVKQPAIYLVSELEDLTMHPKNVRHSNWSFHIRELFYKLLNELQGAAWNIPPKPFKPVQTSTAATGILTNRVPIAIVWWHSLVSFGAAQI